MEARVMEQGCTALRRNGLSPNLKSEFRGGPKPEAKPGNFIPVAQIGNLPYRRTVFCGL